jgi:hypothetical protein
MTGNQKQREMEKGRANPEKSCAAASPLSQESLALAASACFQEAVPKINDAEDIPMPQ